MEPGFVHPSISCHCGGHRIGVQIMASLSTLYCRLFQWQLFLHFPSTGLLCYASHHISSVCISISFLVINHQPLHYSPQRVSMSEKEEEEKKDWERGILWIENKTLKHFLKFPARLKWLAGFCSCVLVAIVGFLPPATFFHCHHLACKFFPPLYLTGPAYRDNKLGPK